jgi:hypothetical protein
MRPPPADSPEFVRRFDAGDEAFAMIAILLGLIVLAGAGAGFWVLQPREGVVHPLVVMPVLESLVPLGIVAGFALGAAMILAGVTQF